MTPQDFITQIGPAARTGCQQTGIPASITLAQAALESGWGSSSLAVKGKNLFGIKAFNWDGPTMQLPTHEVVNGQVQTVLASWRVYKDWGGSILDHANFFFANQRYEPALLLVENPQAFVAAIAKAGYSTDPGYASKIMQIVSSHNLTQFDVPKDQWDLIEWAKYE